MTTEKMNIHKALSELKVLDSRITKEVQTPTYCIANKQSNKKIKGVDVKDFEETIKASYDKVSDLISRRKALKKAIVLSNAITKVMINDTEYSVAEAIEMKQTGIMYEKSLLVKFHSDYEKAQREIASNDRDLGIGVENHILGLFGSKDGKQNTDEIAKQTQIYIEMNQFVLVDPIKVLDKIQKLQDSIDKFESEVDSALSYSNAITEIIIEY